MKRKNISFILAVMVIINLFTFLPVEAAESTYGIYKFKVPAGDRCVIITGCDTSVSGDIEIPEVIPINNFGEEFIVRGIGYAAFKNCTGIKSVTIPDSIISIENYAFENCTGLVDVKLPDTITSINSVFRGCTSLESIEIPDSVTNMTNAFYGCTSLKSVNIPNGVTSISGAFYLCRSLESIEIPDSVTDISGAFVGCGSLKSVEIPDSVTDIGGAFAGCESLKSIEIPKKVTKIGESTFRGCTGISSINIPEGVTEIGQDAFEECTSLSVINIPDSVTKIAFEAFEDTKYCNTESNWENGVLYIGKHLIEAKQSLSGSYSVKDATLTIAEHAFFACGINEIIIPDSVKSINDQAFKLCYMLENIVIGNGVRNIGYNAFYDTAYYGNEENWENDSLYIGKYLIKVKNTVSGNYNVKSGTLAIGDYAFSSCNSLSHVTIPDGVKSVGLMAFSYCSSLTSIKVPDSVETIGRLAFGYCTGLGDVTLGRGITSIEKETFKSCTALKSINIPNSVSSIGDDAFYECKTLDGVRFSGNLKRIGRSAFYGCENLSSIIIPGSVKSIEHAAFANCKNLSSIIISEGITDIGGNAFIYCPIENIRIPRSVQNIGGGAFLGCDLLTDIIIPNGIRYIPERLFWSCDRLRSVAIPGSVKTIGYEAFDLCNMLRTIYYSGTQKDWENTPEGAGNLRLKSATVYFESGKLIYGDYNKIDADATAEMLAESLKINGKGRAYARIVLRNSAGSTLSNKYITYKFDGYNETYEAVTDENGILTVETPQISKSKTFTVELFETGLDKNRFTFNVEVLPLSFTQKWEGKITAIGGAEAEFGVGGTVGVLEAEAKLASIGAEMRNARVFYLENGYENGKRFIEIGNRADYNIAGNADVGVMAALKGAASNAENKLVDFSPLNVGGSASYGNGREASVKIDNYNPQNEEHLLQIGYFLLDSITSLNKSNVVLRKILENWDIKTFNQHGVQQSVKLEGGAKIAAVGVGPIEGELGGISKESLYQASTKTDKDNKVTHSSSLVTGSGYKLFDINGNFGIGKKNDFEIGTTAWGKDFINNQVTVSASKNGGSVDKVTVKALEKNNNSSILWGVDNECDYQTLTFGGKYARYLSEDDKNIGKLADGKKAFFTRTQMENVVNRALLSGFDAEYGKDKEFEKGFDAEIALGVTAGLGFKFGFGVSGISTTQYSYESGIMTNNAIYKTSRSDIKSEVDDRKMQLSTIIDEVADAVKERVEQLIVKIEGIVKDGVEYAKAVVKGSAEWVCEIVSFDDETYGLKSYRVLSVEDEYSLFSTSSVVSTIGKPYVLNVKDKSGNPVEDFGGAPLTLTISYSDDDLAIANVSNTQAELENLKIYRWSEEKAAYVFVGGELDLEDKSVTAEILKPGQYILAIDNCAPTITELDVNTVSGKYVISAKIADMSGIDEFEFKLDGKTVIESGKFDDYYNPLTAVFEYTVYDELEEGEHSISMLASDTSGNKMAVPVLKTFTVDKGVPEVENVQMPTFVTDNTFTVSAQTNADDLSGMYVCVEYLNDIHTYEMTESDGVWTASIGDLPEVAKLKVWVCAYDNSGNEGKGEEEYVFVANKDEDFYIAIFDVDNEGADIAVVNKRNSRKTGNLMVAGYGENGVVMDMESVAYTSIYSEMTKVEILPHCKTYKVFFWGNKQATTPYCESDTLN